MAELTHGNPHTIRQRGSDRSVGLTRLSTPGTICAGGVLALLLVGAVAGPWLFPQDPLVIDLVHTYASPSTRHLLGTDGSGRDVLSRTIAAARLSLLLPLIIVAVSSTAGTLIGLLGSAAGPVTGLLTRKAMALLMSLPGLLLAIVIVARLGTGTVAPTIAVAIGTTPHITLVVQSATRELLARQFVTAYRVNGYSTRWILLHRGIPHLIPVIGTQSLMNLGSSLLWLSGLSFLGLGIQPPAADWGLLIQDGRDAALRGLYLPTLAPTVCLATFVLATHTLAEQFHQGPGTHRQHVTHRTKKKATSQSVQQDTTDTDGTARADPSAAIDSTLTLQNFHLSVDHTLLIDGGQLEVQPGEIICLVGPSGSGKTMLLRSIIGQLPPTATAAGGWLTGFGPLPGTTSSRQPSSPAALRRLRHTIGTIYQTPRASLNPYRTIAAHLTEPARDAGVPTATAHARALRLVNDVGLPTSILQQRPTALSGGMVQRVAIAGALITSPTLILADEPTAALDPLTSQHVIDTLHAVTRKQRAGLLITTHDDELANTIADRIYRIEHHKLTETTASPTPHPASRTHLQNHPGRSPVVPRHNPTPGNSTKKLPSNRPRIVLTDVRKEYGTTTALTGINLKIDEPLGILGRSGSGKSTLARLLVGLETPDHGTITHHPSGTTTNSRQLPGPEHARRTQLAWQDPDLALDPRQRIGPDLQRLIDLHQRSDTATALLAHVGLGPDTAKVRPGELSLGMARRVILARTIAIRPTWLILDEPTAGLDIRTAANIIALLRDLSSDMTPIAISHHRQVLAALSHNVVVLEAGRTVQHGTVDHILPPDGSDRIAAIMHQRQHTPGTTNRNSCESNDPATYACDVYH